MAARATALAIALTTLAPVEQGTAADVLDAGASDPVTLGWMVGTPPPPEKSIRVQDGSFYRFPQFRWSFSHWRELFPSKNVARGNGPVSPLPQGKPADLDGLSFVPFGAIEPMTWAESLAANYTDGIVVLHQGRIVYERYFGALAADRQHIAFSVTKSFIGTLATMLIAEGKLDPKATVAHYIPELAASGFGDATVQQVLDMTTALDFDENYANPDAAVWQYARAVGMLPRLPGQTGPSTNYDYLPTIKKNGTHGPVFNYRSPNTDVAGWLISRASGQSIEGLLQERIWSRIGAEADAFLTVDSAGTALAAGGLNTRLRDLARFGETLRLGGRINGQQVVPQAVVEEIRRGGSREAFANAPYPALKGWSYHNQWWVSHDDHGVFMARGIHGQAIYVDPKADMVIARYASHPKAGNVALDPTSLPAYRAVADYLTKR